MTDEENIKLPSLTLSTDHIEDRDSLEFSTRIKDTRSRRGLTLKALSLVTKVVDPEKKGISTVSISRYESGAEPGMRELKLLSLALYKPISWLVYGASEDPLSPASRGSISFDMLIDDLIGNSIHDALIQHGVIKANPVKTILSKQQYLEMIEEVKKIAK